MKEKLVTLALAGGALALFYLLFIPKPTPEREKITLPLSSERGANGYAVLHRWLQSENYSIVSLRDRYNRLPALAPGSGHILITTLPHRLSARPSELTVLSDWLNEGNTLLAMAALADTPDWAMQPSFERDLIAQLQAMTGIKFVALAANEATDAADGERKPSRSQRVAEAFEKLLEPQRHRMQPIGQHPLTAGVQSVAAISEFPAADWTAESEIGDLVLELALDPDSQRQVREPVLWLTEMRGGQIIVSGYGSPFTNKLLGEADNARLLANIVQWSLGAKSSIIIDDTHQGAVAFYDPGAFFADPRLHHTLYWLLALWFVFVLSPARLRPTPTSWQPVDLTTFIRATGGFIARAVKPAAAGRVTLAHFFDGMRRRLGLPEDGKPMWEWLASQPHVMPQDLIELRVLHARATAGKRIDLVKLNNLLQRLSGTFV